jgi:catechol 2,3-dioxygenase-like lactoylglutathione lyase family enzyme
MHIKGLLHVNINCNNFERSKKFYELLGFEVLAPVPSEGMDAVARAVGFDHYRVRGALMKHPSRIIIDLLEWEEPRGLAVSRQALNDVGIARIALITEDLDADIQTLRQHGVELVSEQSAEARGPSGSPVRFICFRDPDGNTLELVQM